MKKNLTNFLNQLLSFLSPNDKYQLEIKTDKNEIRINIQLDQAAGLIGRKGENIHFLHHLIWLYLRLNHDFQGKLYLDINDYLKEKENKLQQWIEKEIKQIISLQQPRSFYNLSSYERRLIHLACSQNPQVSSQSHDTPQGRVLTISPTREDEK